ncbi:MAG: tripartite tricarboxylate transporter substrate binding protein [Candidatus Rokubacteria bacterium]|nr:tripartite tricarboxylate transporter substrate binding protein [Candidatus Rokubacteria bacterium]
MRQGNRGRRIGAMSSSVVLAVLVATGPPPATAQDFPTKPITLIIPFGPGGSHDLTARALVSVVPSYLPQPVVIQLRPGGGGAIGSDQVAKAKPDGYTLLFGAAQTNSIMPAVEGRSHGPDTLRAVCKINESPIVLVTRSDRPYRDLKEMVAWAKANPDRLINSSSGPWAAADVLMKQLMKDYSVTGQTVPYDGGGPALLAVLGGHADITFTLTAQGLPHIKAGKLRPLAVTGKKRHPELPDVPTAVEQGFNLTYTFWRAVLAPKGMPEAVVEKLATVFKQVTEDKSFQALIKQLGDEPGFLGPEEFAKEWRAEFEAHRELGKLYKK